MTMIEKQIESAKKNIEKFQKSIARNEKLLAKRVEICEKLDCNWNWDEWFQHRENDTYSHEQYCAWSDKEGTECDLNEVKEKLDKEMKRLNKLEGNAIENEAQVAEKERVNKMETKWLESIKMTAEERKAEYERWLKWFKEECLKDGVKIEGADGFAVYGTNKNGKHFSMYINEGYTERSNHCYTLRINGQTVFTSGTFATGYKIAMG